MRSSYSITDIRGRRETTAIPRNNIAWLRLSEHTREWLCHDLGIHTNSNVPITVVEPSSEPSSLHDWLVDPTSIVRSTIIDRAWNAMLENRAMPDGLHYITYLQHTGQAIEGVKIAFLEAIDKRVNPQKMGWLTHLNNHVMCVAKDPLLAYQQAYLTEWGNFARSFEAVAVVSAKTYLGEHYPDDDQLQAKTKTSSPTPRIIIAEDSITTSRPGEFDAHAKFELKTVVGDLEGATETQLATVNHDAIEITRTLSGKLKRTRVNAPSSNSGKTNTEITLQMLTEQSRAHFHSQQEKIRSANKNANETVTIVRLTSIDAAQKQRTTFIAESAAIMQINLENLRNQQPQDVMYFAQLPYNKKGKAISDSSNIVSLIAKIHCELFMINALNRLGASEGNEPQRDAPLTKALKKYQSFLSQESISPANIDVMMKNGEREIREKALTLSNQLSNIRKNQAGKFKESCLESPQLTKTAQAFCVLMTSGSTTAGNNDKIKPLNIDFYGHEYIQLLSFLVGCETVTPCLIVGCKSAIDRTSLHEAGTQAKQHPEVIDALDAFIQTPNNKTAKLLQAAYQKHLNLFYGIEVEKRSVDGRTPKGTPPLLGYLPCDTNVIAPANLHFPPKKLTMVTQGKPSDPYSIFFSTIMPIAIVLAPLDKCVEADKESGEVRHPTARNIHIIMTMIPIMIFFQNTTTVINDIKKESVSCVTFGNMLEALSMATLAVGSAMHIGNDTHPFSQKSANNMPLAVCSLIATKQLIAATKTGWQERRLIGTISHAFFAITNLLGLMLAVCEKLSTPKEPLDSLALPMTISIIALSIAGTACHFLPEKTTRIDHRKANQIALKAKLNSLPMLQTGDENKKDFMHGVMALLVNDTQVCDMYQLINNCSELADDVIEATITRLLTAHPSADEQNNRESLSATLLPGEPQSLIANVIKTVKQEKRKHNNDKMLLELPPSLITVETIRDTLASSCAAEDTSHDRRLSEKPVSSQLVLTEVDGEAIQAHKEQIISEANSFRLTLVNFIDNDDISETTACALIKRWLESRLQSIVTANYLITLPTLSSMDDAIVAIDAINEVILPFSNDHRTHQSHLYRLIKSEVQRSLPLAYLNTPQTSSAGASHSPRGSSDDSDYSMNQRISFETSRERGSFDTFRGSRGSNASATTTVSTRTATANHSKGPASLNVR